MEAPPGPPPDSTENAPDLLHVRLASFDGPLDLLLHLVRKQQLDIQQVRLAELTEPYLAYLGQLQELNLDTAGEFLSIAATLVWIKSKSLLPREAVEEEFDPEEAEAMLRERLKEYQHIKDAAARLTGLDLLGRDVFPRQATEDGTDTQAPQEVCQIEPVSLFELIEAYRDVLRRAEESPALSVVPLREGIEQRISRLLERFASRNTLAFRELFEPGASRDDLILAFISLLELVRLKAIRVTQVRSGGEIICHVSETFAGSAEDWAELVLAALFGQGNAAGSNQPGAATTRQPGTGVVGTGEPHLTETDAGRITTSAD